MKIAILKKEEIDFYFRGQENGKFKKRKYPIRPAHDNVFLIEQWCGSVLIEKLKGLVLKQ